MDTPIITLVMKQLYPAIVIISEVKSSTSSSPLELKLEAQAASSECLASRKVSDWSWKKSAPEPKTRYEEKM